MSSPTFILAITTAVQAFTSLSSVAVPVFAPSAARELGIAVGIVGYFISIMYIGASTSALVSGGFILRYGPIRVSQACLLLCATAMVLLTVVPIALIPIAAILLGIGYGPITPASSHVLARTTPPHLMALTFSIKQTGVPLGAVMAGILVPPVTLAFGWRAAAWMVALFCVVMAVISQSLRVELDADRKPAHPISLANFTLPFRLIFADPALVRNVFTASAYASLQLCFFTFVVAYLTQDLAYTLVAAGLALSFANVGGVIGRVVWGWVADRTRSPRMVMGVLGIAMSIASIGIASFTPGWPYALVLAVCALFGITAVSWNGVQISETARLSPPGMAAVVSGGSSFITFAGIIFAPTLFALVHELTDSWRLPFVLVCLPALAMGVVQLVYARR